MMIDQPKTYHVLTWGCQMNEEDSEQIGLHLEAIGCARTDTAATADVLVLNTCSVRRKPEDKVYSKLGEIREIKAARPRMVVAVCGCMAQVEHAQIQKRAPFVDVVIGTGNLAEIGGLVRTAWSQTSGEPVRRRRAALTSLSLPARKGAVVTDVPIRAIERTSQLRAYVPIMYGCDKFCTFCIVPQTRGRERSRPPSEIVDEVRRLADNGTREVTLLGQTVNSYGKNLENGRVPFAHLLEMVAAIPGIDRVRYTSPYPRDFTDDLVAAIARIPEVCEHVHLPLQVADDGLLAGMNRGYTVARYEQIVDLLRGSVPGISITTDIMLGYPGESDAQFDNTMRFAEQMRFDAAFMFAYSPRPGTKAATMPNQVPQAIKVQRLNALIEMQNRITLEINREHVGTVHEVLVDGLSPRDPDRLTGLTRSFKTANFSVRAEHGPAAGLRGKLALVSVSEGHITGFTGECVGVR